MITQRLLAGFSGRVKNQTLMLDNPEGWSKGLPLPGAGQTAAMKISAVNACVEVLSGSLAKLPAFVMDSKSKEHLEHPLLKVLTQRPNEAMAPAVYKKLMESSRLLRGNAYAWIVRDYISLRPAELIPLPSDYVKLRIDDNGDIWYEFIHPRTGQMRYIPSCDMLHYKAYSEDGFTGISVLRRATHCIETAQAVQQYERQFYREGGQLSGVLQVDANLDSKAKDAVRQEWSRVYSGADNAFRVAVLDLGMKYQPLSVTQSDAQFVQSKAVSVEDIARFFGVPPYKLGAGKQSYSSNEQNAIEYVVSTLQPIITQYEEEDSYKLLTISERRQGLEVRRNMMAELRGDTTARGNWYRIMRQYGVFSVNDIRALEDMPAVEGGDSRNASLNYVPLEDFAELSRARNIKPVNGAEENDWEQDWGEKD